MNFNRKINREKYTSDDLPAYPARILTIHVGIKGIQAGSVIGLVAGVPIVSYLKKIPLRTAWFKVMPEAPLIGCAVALSLLAAKHLHTPMDEDGVDDRAFRIVNNAGQVKVDRYSFIVGGIGAAVGAVTIRGFRPILASSATGVAFGVVFHVIESNKEKIKSFF